MKRVLSISMVAAAIFFAGVSVSSAGIISSGLFDVGINDTYGNLYDGDSVGFRRNSDGSDYILPGTPREAYGVSQGSLFGHADGASIGNFNLTPISSVFTPTTATIVVQMQDLLITNQYSFVAKNVLLDLVTIENTSSTSASVAYSRIVDMDLGAGGGFYEQITADARPGDVSGSSFDGFESPNPLIAFGADAGASGGVFPAGDQGAGLLLTRTLAAGDSWTFSIFHGFNQYLQTETGLRSQVYGLGATFLISGVDGNNPATGQSAVLGYAGDGFIEASVPEPTSMAIFAIGGLGLAAGAVRRRRNA